MAGAGRVMVNGLTDDDIPVRRSYEKDRSYASVPMNELAPSFMKEPPIIFPTRD